VNSQTSISSRTSLALTNLRGFTIILVVIFHSLMAYLAYNPAPHPRFFPPPLISDSQRWIGFDLLCASLFVYMMQFMFLLSGLFVWPSLVHRGAGQFLRRRLWRLGIPFVLGVYLTMPLAHLPVYLLNNPTPTWSGFWSEWLALPYWPSGQLWFLWCLLVLDVAAAAIYMFAPRSAEYLGRLATLGKEHPIQFFWILLIASAIAYIPLAFAFLPWEWAHFGPFAFQPSFAVLYIVYFAAGLGMGICGIESSLFGAAGNLSHGWIKWTATAFLGFIFWTIPTALAIQAESSIIPLLNVIAAFGFVTASTSACFALAAVFLRYWTEPSRFLATLSTHAYGIYFFHYGIVLWLQYMLLDLPLIAPLKAAIVIAGTLFLSWAASAMAARIGSEVMLARLARIQAR